MIKIVNLTDSPIDISIAEEGNILYILKGKAKDPKRKASTILPNKDLEIKGNLKFNY